MLLVLGVRCFGDEKAEALQLLYAPPVPRTVASGFKVYTLDGCYRPLRYLSDFHPNDPEVKRAVLSWYSNLSALIEELGSRESEVNQNTIDESLLDDRERIKTNAIQRERGKILNIERFVIRFVPEKLEIEDLRAVLRYPWESIESYYSLSYRFTALYGEIGVPGLALPNVIRALSDFRDEPLAPSILQLAFDQRLSSGLKFSLGEDDAVQEVLTFPERYPEPVRRIAMSAITQRPYIPITTFRLSSLIQALPVHGHALPAPLVGPYCDALALRLRHELINYSGLNPASLLYTFRPLMALPESDWTDSFFLRNLDVLGITGEARQYASARLRVLISRGTEKNRDLILRYLDYLAHYPPVDLQPFRISVEALRQEGFGHRRALDTNVLNRARARVSVWQQFRRGCAGLVAGRWNRQIADRQLNLPLYPEPLR